MNKFPFLWLLLVSAHMTVFSQISNDDVLFSVGDEPILAQEFIRVYNKNLEIVQDESQKDIDAYLNLFVNYKLKLQEAKSIGLDKKPSYLKELKGYQKQLSKKYLTESNVTEALIKEAYDRMSYEIKAQHILVRIEEYEKDTTAYYKKILNFKERFFKQGFESVKTSVHNGNTVFVEDLGYFSSFKMVYDFESAAYNTGVGEISDPFRTQYGYHVVKVLDKRKSQGEVTVGHIMISLNENDSLAKAEVRINELYKMLQQGQKFESLAQQFSEDKSSAKMGGKLKSFKTGQLASAEFEKVAFSLQNNGDISIPFKTSYGWHIVKLYNKTPLASYEQLKSDLEQQVKRDSRSKLISSAMSKKLRQNYKVPEAAVVLPNFLEFFDEEFFKNTWTLSESFEGSKQFIVIGNKQLVYSDFYNYLNNSKRGLKVRQSVTDFVTTQYENFVNSEVLKYHEENLEFVNVDFANILNEYREGLLLFDLMEDKVWNAVKSDTAALHAFYESNKKDYLNPEKVKAILVTSPKKEFIKKAKKLLIENKTVEEIKQQINTSDQNILVTTGMLSKNTNIIPEDFLMKIGLSDIYKWNKAYHIVMVTEVLPESIKTFEDAKGLVISDYQIIYEKNWMEVLSKKYKVSVNKEVLKRTKQQLNN
ncbi:peptidylprolyl isomerase [Flavobacteriaceae bacterium]|jgi:peptidyl-prolyl cis-trans isomerase SurA|nr:peptidylprolyl isomerase [Flavobacteriaceae bacterium]MDC0957275.1 peptidylprolyl isomerase [Flavobacteriaceae bacterium]